MDLFQATEAAEWARKCYAEELSRAERERTHNIPHSEVARNAGAAHLAKHPVFATLVILALVTILALAAA